MGTASDGKVVISTVLSNKGLKKGIRNISGSLGGLRGVFASLMKTIGTVITVQQIVRFGTESVKAANAMSDALTGLQSVVEGQGRSFKEAQKFIDEYTADGLVPATNAINAYKNLSLRGYDDSQIRQVMVALKDSAAFGRQASYTMGQAVESASEGLKNENSILVDNAGVTKNVAKMWDDYARSIGTTANNLTQQQKIQAEVNGILEESKYQAGDAAKVAGTFSGQLMQLSFNFNNLKVAVGNAIIPVLQQIMPVINAIIAGLTRMANAVAAVIGAIFGKAKVNQNTQALAAGNQQVAVSAGSGASAEKELARNTKKAGKAAKGALAAFDELNVLQQDAGSTSGGGSSGGASSVGAGSAAPVMAEMEVEDTLSPRLQAIVDKIRELMKSIVDKIHELVQPLQQIDFGPLSAAFERLGKAIAPLTYQLFAGLEWAYYHIFVPLAAWTIEDFLPAFLDVLAGACRVLSEVLKALAPLGQWLWDHFLAPIAEWTGGVIVTVLNFLADALDRIAIWISEHQTLLETLIIIIGSLAAAWALVNGALMIWNGLVFLWNSLGAIATAVTTAFGVAVAFLTSPIGIVIIAIGALIAIIVLLVRHWDEVKEVAFAVWEKIKETWSVVCDWFKSTVIDPLVDAWTVFKEGFIKLWDGIVDGVKGAINSVIGFVNGMISAVVNGVNWVINALNKLSWEIPDWVPEVGGKTFGFNIPTLNAPQIPMLAQGAVLPANKPFLAMVGDQKNGTNIEAPLDTIKQALAEVMDQQGSQEITIKFAASGGLEQLVRLLKPYIDGENNRTGAKLITGGVY